MASSAMLMLKITSITRTFSGRHVPAGKEETTENMGPYQSSYTLDWTRHV